MKIYSIATLVISISSLLVISCQKNTRDIVSDQTSIAEENTLSEESARHGGDNQEGYVYTATNETSGNKIKVYKRGSDGRLVYQSSFATGGNGTGGGLGNQGGMILSEDGETLLVVNAGSNSVSSMKVVGNGNLVLKSAVSSGGTMPVSIALHDDLVYILNSGGDGNIAGFKLGSNDKLTYLSNSTRPLSSTSSGAAQVSFVRNGSVLAITEKATNKIVTYRVGESGRPFGMKDITSANTTPFGFASGRFGNIYVSEAAGGAAGASTISSYHISYNGSISLTDGPVSANQSAACWVVLTDNGKYLYTTNAASNNISSFNVNPYSGNLSVLNATAAASGMGPIDAALSTNSKFLYVLNSGSHSISAYKVMNNGNLDFVETTMGLPMGANGLAAR